MSTKLENTKTPEAYLEEGQTTPDTTVKDTQGTLVRYDHKDGLQRYTNVEFVYKNKDHFLQPDNGKLEILRVQIAPTSKLSTHQSLPWERPLEDSQFKSLWKAFRNSPRSIIRWTYDDFLKCKRVFIPRQLAQ